VGADHLAPPNDSNERVGRGAVSLLPMQPIAIEIGSIPEPRTPCSNYVGFFGLFAGLQ
jgi:hypothetical protein